MPFYLRGLKRNIILILKVFLIGNRQLNVHVNPSLISSFFSSSHSFLKNQETQKKYFEDIMLFVIKFFLPMTIIESIWLQRLAL
jgi:hypothetical protein